jgi:RimJ/RimL family protein N-acetyltransferase
VQVYLDTERLILRRFTAADEDDLLELDADPEVMRYLSGGRPTPRRLIHDEILPRIIGYYDRHPGFGSWALVEKFTGAFVGWIALRPPEGKGIEDVELGYRLRRSAWGKGYATEAARTLVRKGFAELGVERVFATTYQDNLASRRVMEKLGMTLVRCFRLTPADLATAGTYDAGDATVWDGDDVEYALTKAEFRD